ncbi:hypothetical protein BVRB_1g021650 isoform B [Beta vulgaris subsp. vulgaris]|uniref:Uncharacterized protein n=1 Tax=Beta vulgaris subsp. vulgaris TaxID=3555 RepID=A0A0J8BI75_BETVV|nr:hypothetical protein BVRB_1g021650 isoform B [Beta vulgaris subsp. vulgaris]
MDDERPPRGRDHGHAAVHLEGRIVTPVIQENLDRPVKAGHLENVLNDFQTRMAAVMEEQIKSNMLFFQLSPGGEAIAPLKGRSQEGRPGTSQPPQPELTRSLSKGKKPAVSDSRRKMDWRLVVRPGDNIPPTGHKMETDDREYLEAKRAAAQQHSTSGSTPYIKDPSLRLPSRTVARSHGPSAFQPRQEKTVLQPMVFRRQALANTSSNPVLKEYRREHIPIEGQIGSLYGDQQAARECYLTTLKPSSWKEKAKRPKVREDDSAEKVKGQIVELKQEVEKVQELPLPESKPSMLLPSKKRKCLAIKEEKHSSEEIMAIMSLGLEHPEPGMRTNSSRAWRRRRLRIRWGPGGFTDVKESRSESSIVESMGGGSGGLMGDQTRGVFERGGAENCSCGARGGQGGSNVGRKIENHQGTNLQPSPERGQQVVQMDVVGCGSGGGPELFWIPKEDLYWVNCVKDLHLSYLVEALLSVVVKRVKGFIQLKIALGALHEALPDATSEEIQAYDDECAICRDINRSHWQRLKGFLAITFSILLA